MTSQELKELSKLCQPVAEFLKEHGDIIAMVEICSMYTLFKDTEIREYIDKYSFMDKH